MNSNCIFTRSLKLSVHSDATSDLSVYFYNPSLLNHVPSVHLFLKEFLFIKRLISRLFDFANDSPIYNEITVFDEAKFTWKLAGDLTDIYSFIDRYCLKERKSGRDKGNARRFNKACKWARK